MVSYLATYYSHPDKFLEQHIAGITAILRQCADYPRLVILAGIFHDFGKMNLNFQKKIKGKKVFGYSNHAYLSALIFFHFYEKNKALLYSELQAKNQEEFLIKVNVIIALIISHHSNLDDLAKDFSSSDELANAWNFIESQSFPDASSFLSEVYEHPHDSFHLPGVRPNKMLEFNFIPGISGKAWKEQALDYFMETQYAFALLIHADKRDAGNYQTYLNELLTPLKQHLDVVLTDKFKEQTPTPQTSELNCCRTAIREEATTQCRELILESIVNGNLQRIFTVISPTGSGKTYTLLSLAREIQQLRGDLGIIYAVPFLSITDQVKWILEHDLKLDILTVNSKNANPYLEIAIKEYENSSCEENLNKVLQYHFAEHSFDAPFVLTTFVQLFETLVSNRNSTLVKLSNFTNRIFLIDEFQALPPRLYIFFSAWLDTFCRKHNCYAIFSTATMPCLAMPSCEASEASDTNPRALFKDYCIPTELLNAEHYFSQKAFNRYRIRIPEKQEMPSEELAQHVLERNKSALIILNTIQDSLDLYADLKKLSPETNIVLLNTRLMPIDRQRKIEQIKDFLKKGEKVILVSTQLIEAGVDIDFPIVYRDFCPLASLIQSAGRCNRNCLQEFGEVFFIKLINKKGKFSYQYIYEQDEANFLGICNELLYNNMKESELFPIQKQYYNKIKEELIVGKFQTSISKDNNMIQMINRAEFGKLGTFKLIEEDKFGVEFRYYIPESENDTTLHDLTTLRRQLIQESDYTKRMAAFVQVNTKLKNINERVVNIRLSHMKNTLTPPLSANPEELFGLFILADLTKYQSEIGLILDNSNNFL